MVFYVFLLNIIICISQLLRNSNETYSLHKIVNIFILTFFLIANYYQYITNSNTTSLYINFSSDDYLVFQSVVLFIQLLYNFIYHVIRKQQEFISESFIDYYEEEINSKKLIFISLVAFAIIIFAFRNQPLLLFFRGIADNAKESEDTGNAMSLIIGKFIRPIPFCCYLYSKLRFNSSKRLRTILFLIMTISIFPTGLARNAVAMFWLPVCMVNINLLYKRYLFTCIFLLLIFFVFPFLDNFRSYNGEISTDFDYSYLLTMNFDSSQMFMTVMNWDIVTYGKQLLGVIFFFVPRAIWPDKAIGSGHYIANLQGAFPNISMPYFGEGYINFGLIGVIIFTAILAYITAKLDVRYWQNKEIFTWKPSMGFYLILVGALFFILRGDLLSSVAYTTGVSISYWTVYRLNQK